MPEVAIEAREMDIDSISMYSKNSKKHPESQIKNLVAAIQRFGFTQPIVVNDNNTILAGHGRFEAARRLGLKTVPVRIVAGLTAAEQKAYVIADNKIAEQSLWDYENLESEISSISGLDLGQDLNSLLDYNTFVTTKIEQVPVGELKPHPENYKTHPESQLEHLKKSIQEHGIYRNIIIATDGTILAGHGVVNAAKSLGLASVPCLRTNLEANDVKALKILTADNEISHMGDANARELTDVLKKILVDDDLLGTGYDQQKLEALLMVSRSKDELKQLNDEDWDNSLDFSPMDNAIKCVVSFENEQDRLDFFKTLGVSHTDKTKKLWWPVKERQKVSDKLYIEDSDSPF